MRGRILMVLLATVAAVASSRLEARTRLNGTPRDHGLFLLVENVDTNFIQARLTLRDGAILKPSTRNPFVDLSAAWSKYNQTYEPKTDLTDAEKERPWVRGGTFLERMNTVPAHRTAYLARMREFSSTLFAPARFTAQVAGLAPRHPGWSAERTGESARSIKGPPVRPEFCGSRRRGRSRLWSARNTR